jgi:hypothetical protein
MSGPPPTMHRIRSQLNPESIHGGRIKLVSDRETRVRDGPARSSSATALIDGEPEDNKGIDHAVIERPISRQCSLSWHFEWLLWVDCRLGPRPPIYSRSSLEWARFLASGRPREAVSDAV